MRRKRLSVRDIEARADWDAQRLVDRGEISDVRLAFEPILQGYRSEGRRAGPRLRAIVSARLRVLRENQRTTP